MVHPYYAQLAQKGRYGDDRLAHLCPASQFILKANGGSGTINPATGLPEYGFNLGRMLKTVVGTAIGAAIGGPVGAAIGGGLGNSVGERGNFAQNFLTGGVQGFIGNGALTGNWGFAQTAGLGSFLGGTAATTAANAFSGLSPAATALESVPASQIGVIRPGSEFGKPYSILESAKAAITNPATSNSSGSFMTDIFNQGKDYVKNHPMQAAGLGIAAAHALLSKEERRPPSVEDSREWEELKGRGPRPYMAAVPYELPFPKAPAGHFAQGGLIAGSDPGQSDKIPEDLEEEDFIIPADVVAHQGDGNTLAGGKHLDQYVNALMYKAHKLQHHASGGRIRLHLSKPPRDVPAMVSSGEYHVPRVAVLAQGNGDPKKGAEAFYRYMKNIRRHKAISKFPPKAKSISTYIGAR